jgi:predicted unusual protein kinase regulating ubiquinone biosynthesis (AarF/ABC1/UbiB family)
MPDGRVAFLDFGCIAEFEPELRGKINTVVRGVLTDDLELWRSAMESIGYLPPGLELSTDTLWQQMQVYYAFILEDGVSFTPEMAAQMVRQNLAITGETGRINRQLTIPGGVVFIQRITFGFSGLMAGILAQGPWKSITAEYVLDAPPATELGRQSQAFSPPGMWV